MKKQLLVAVAAGLIGTSAMAQSAFEGFYGQVATGYENNSISSPGLTTQDTGKSANSWNASNQSFGGAPIVLGLGYNFVVAPQWLLGLGADYSVLSQTSSTFSSTNPNAGSGTAGGTLTGQTYKVSNRYNIFVAPGYSINKDKLVYLKAGYSSVSLTANSPTQYIDNGDSTQNSSIASGSKSQTLSGYIVGLGYKQMIADGFYGFAEGNYMSYSKANFSSTSDGTTLSANPSLNSYQFLVGLGYKF